MKKLNLCCNCFLQSKLLISFFCIQFFSVYKLKGQPQLVFAPIIQNLVLPIEISNAGDGSGRLFICEQGGLVKIYKNGKLLKRPFLDLSNIVQTGKEYPGLYAIEFPPDYITSRFFFVHYVNKSGYTILARYRTSYINPDSAVASSGVTLLAIDGKGTGGAHTGDMHFGKDGYLYVSFNDGSFYSRTSDHALNGQSLLGKILRIDVTRKDSPYYSIPPDNPFINDPNIRDEVWALGLRNAWRWSFDKSNGNMWITDVGGDKWEEVNRRYPNQLKGANFGWPCYEANAPFDTVECGNKSKYAFPLFVYPHASATSAEVITGGYVYRGNAYPALLGYYICMDYTRGFAWKLKPNGQGGVNAYKQTGLPLAIVGFGEAESGELYAASLLGGTVYQVQATTSLIDAPLPISSISSGHLLIDGNKHTQIYPTIISNGKITLDLKETYQSVHLFDIAGHKLLSQKLYIGRGKMTINLPQLNAGTYILKLEGSPGIQQKIFIIR